MARFRLRYLGREIDLEPGELVLGRSSSCDVPLDDDKASRKHARILVSTDGARIEDLESRNGVRVDGTTIEKIVPLKHRARIDIGSQVLLFIDTKSRESMAEATTAGDEGDPLEGLSAREREVLELVARGHTHKEIAAQLSISVKTVETYRARLVTKMELRTRAQIVDFALKHGILRPG